MLDLPTFRDEVYVAITEAYPCWNPLTDQCEEQPPGTIHGYTLSIIMGEQREYSPINLTMRITMGAGIYDYIWIGHWGYKQAVNLRKYEKCDRVLQNIDTAIEEMYNIYKNNRKDTWYKWSENHDTKTDVIEDLLDDKFPEGSNEGLAYKILNDIWESRETVEIMKGIRITKIDKWNTAQAETLNFESFEFYLNKALDANTGSHFFTIKTEYGYHIYDIRRHVYTHDFIPIVGKIVNRKHTHSYQTYRDPYPSKPLKDEDGNLAERLWSVFFATEHCQGCFQPIVKEYIGLDLHTKDCKCKTKDTDQDCYICQEKFYCGLIDTPRFGPMRKYPKGKAHTLCHKMDHHEKRSILLKKLSNNPY